MIAPEVFTFADPQRLARAAAEAVVEVLRHAIDAHGRADLVITGGSTPRSLYALLASDYANALEWAKVDVFFSDERHVPHNHEDSNFRMARDAFLNALVPPERVHPFPTGATPDADALAYERTLRDHFGDEPAFDLVLLGIGEDGHVASLFPGIAALDETDRWAIATEAPPSSAVRERLSLTLPVLNAGRVTLFLATGEAKRNAVAAVLRDPDRSPPAERVTARERLLWFVDETAAG
jgi:6-phosphogluconolactonase